MWIDPISALLGKLLDFRNLKNVMIKLSNFIFQFLYSKNIFHFFLMKIGLPS